MLNSNHGSINTVPHFTNTPVLASCHYDWRWAVARWRVLPLLQTWKLIWIIIAFSCKDVWVQLETLGIVQLLGRVISLEYTFVDKLFRLVFHDTWMSWVAHFVGTHVHVFDANCGSDRWSLGPLLRWLWPWYHHHWLVVTIITLTLFLETS